MLQNRIVRALMGVVFTKAAVAAGWYFYQKSLKEEANKANKKSSLSSDDLNALETKQPIKVNLSPALEAVHSYLEDQKTQSAVIVKEDVKPKRVRRVVKVEDLESTPPAQAVRKSRVRKTPPTVIESTATKTAVKTPKKGVATKAVAAKVKKAVKSDA